MGDALVDSFSPHARDGRCGRPPFVVKAMLCIHFIKQWFTLSHRVMEKALHDVPLLQAFATRGWNNWPLDESPILRFRHPTERENLAEQNPGAVRDVLQVKDLMLNPGTAVDAALIAPPSSAKNISGAHDLEMRPATKDIRWYLEMTVHIEMDTKLRLVRIVRDTASKVGQVVEPIHLQHGKGTDVFCDSGCQREPKRPDSKGGVLSRHVAMRPGECPALDKSQPECRLVDEIERINAGIRSQSRDSVACQFWLIKLRYRRLTKSTGQLLVRFPLFYPCDPIP